MKKVIEKAIQKLKNDFHTNIGFFYTEDDVVQYFYSILKYESDLIEKDITGNNHLLIHKEYPTPFRCSMANYEFEYKTEEQGGQRGHYDLVILNRKFISNHDYFSVRAQDNTNFLKLIEKAKKPIIDYAFEFSFFRRNFTEKVRYNEVFKIIKQDHDKMQKGKEMGYIKNIKSIVCFEGISEKVESKLLNNFAENEVIILKFNPSIYAKINKRNVKYKSINIE